MKWCGANISISFYFFVTGLVWRTNQIAYTCWSRGKNRSSEKNTRNLWLAEFYELMILLMKCLLTPDCSRAGAVPATQRTSPDPAFFSAPGPTHYREYIYYHVTTPLQPSQDAQDFGRSAPDPYPSWRRGLGTRLRMCGYHSSEYDQDKLVSLVDILISKMCRCTIDIIHNWDLNFCLCARIAVSFSALYYHWVIWMLMCKIILICCLKFQLVSFL